MESSYAVPAYQLHGEHADDENNGSDVVLRGE